MRKRLEPDIAHILSALRPRAVLFLVMGLCVLTCVSYQVGDDCDHNRHCRDPRTPKTMIEAGKVPEHCGGVTVASPRTT